MCACLCVNVLLSVALLLLLLTAAVHFRIPFFCSFNVICALIAFSRLFVSRDFGDSCQISKIHIKKFASFYGFGDNRNASARSHTNPFIISVACLALPGFSLFAWIARLLGLQMLYDDFIKLFRFSAESLAMAKRFGIYIHMNIREQSLQLFSGYTQIMCGRKMFQLKLIL